MTPQSAPTISSRKGGTLELVFPRPHAGQQQIIAEAKRFNVLCCGARFGKTTLGIDRIAHPAIQGFPCAWFAPTYKLLAEPWREMISSNWFGPIIAHKDETEHRIDLTTGGSIECWTLEDANDNTARGRRYKCVVVDEAAGVKDLVSVWQRLIRTRLADYRGDAWFCSTPRGMNGFKTLYDYGLDPARMHEWASWCMPTATNPFIHADEIESAHKELTDARFRQEYLGEFVNWEGAVFRRVREAVSKDCLRSGPEAGHEYVIGADWGRSIDFTVFVVLDVTTGHVVYIDRSNQVDYSLQRGRLKELRDRWHPAQIIAEINSIGQPIIEQLQADGVYVTPFFTSNATKTQAIEALTLAFERSTIGIPDDQLLISELESFTGTVLPSGMIRYSAPGDQHDDIVMALTMAWHGGFGSRRVLGLVEAVKQVEADGELLDGPRQSKHEMEFERMKEEAMKAQATLRGKPSTADQTTRCPTCESICLVKIGLQLRCNQCGWATNSTGKPASQSRGEYLMKTA